MLLEALKSKNLSILRNQRMAMETEIGKGESVWRHWDPARDFPGKFPF